MIRWPRRYPSQWRRGSELFWDRHPRFILEEILPRWTLSLSLALSFFLFLGLKILLPRRGNVRAVLCHSLPFPTKNLFHLDILIETQFSVWLNLRIKAEKSACFFFSGRAVWSPWMPKSSEKTLTRWSISSRITTKASRTSLFAAKCRYCARFWVFSMYLFASLFRLKFLPAV